MKLLLYTSDNSSNSIRLRILVESVMQDAASLETCQSMEALHERFRNPVKDISVAVLVFSSLDELLELQQLEKYIHELRLVLILPDNDRSTIDQAHKLRPRFVADINSDFTVVKVVLKKMLNNKTLASTMQDGLSHYADFI